jgi:hypothetical protein
MKNTKFLYLISFFNLALLIVMLFGFTGAGDKSISIGYNAKIVERDSNLVIMYGDDTPRVIITRIGNNFILGSASNIPRGSITAEYFEGSNGISSFDKAWINSTVGVTEDFYVEGTSKMTGYLTGDSIYARTINTPTGLITALTGTSAVYNRVTGSDSVITGNSISRLFTMRSNSGVAIGKDEGAIYLKGALLIFAYRNSGGTMYYYYANLSSGADINSFTFSFSEP